MAGPESINKNKPKTNNKAQEQVACTRFTGSAHGWCLLGLLYYDKAPTVMERKAR